MKIGEIEFEQRKNLGEYNHVNLKVSALLEDGDTANAVIDKLRKLVKWHLNADEYEAKYKKLSAQTEHTPNEEAWMNQFLERKNEIEAI